MKRIVILLVMMIAVQSLAVEGVYIFDKSGVPNATTDYNELKVFSANFALEVARGRVPGVATFEKYGKNPAVTTAEDIWNGGGTYTGFPTNSAETMEIYSSSANDSTNGTGARTVTIYNLQDGDGNSMPDVTVTMAGTNKIAISTNLYYRGGSRIRVLTNGSGGGNAGNITLRHTTTTNNVFAVMPIGLNSTSIAAYSVPAGKKLYLNRMNIQTARANAQSGTATMSVRARAYGTNTSFQAIVNPEITTAAPYNYDNGFFVFDERTDIKISCDVVSGESIITGEMGGYLIDN